MCERHARVAVQTILREPIRPQTFNRGNCYVRLRGERKMREMTQGMIDRALHLMNRSTQYRMTPTQAREYLDTPYDSGMWAGSPEGEMNRAHHDDMCLCARWSLWFFGA